LFIATLTFINFSRISSLEQSSHIVTTSLHFSEYCDGKFSNRELPLKSTLNDAVEALKCPDANERTALFLGLIPALIYEYHNNNNLHNMPFMNRKIVIKECIGQSEFGVKAVKDLLRSFLTGESMHVMTPLLQLMNTAGEGKVRWIPFHMMEVLKLFAYVLSTSSISRNLMDIVGLFDGFCKAKESSGDAWECLFVIVLIIRSLTAESSDILPLENLAYTVSLNKKMKTSTPFSKYRNFREFIGSIPKKVNCGPHVAVYYFSNNQFARFDVAVAVYNEEGLLEALYCYQLKENGVNPKDDIKYADDDKHITKKFWIKGLPAATDKLLANQWYVPSEGEIDSFFGESGMHWTPKRWKKLWNSRRDSKKIAVVSNGKSEEYIFFL
jgi:hypothetical protein